MAFKEVVALEADVTIALGGINRKTNKKNPTEIEGYYLGKRAVEDKKKKSGVSYIYFLQTNKGNVGVWGKTDLDRKLMSVTPGQMIRITAAGTVPTPNGDMYKYKLEVDPDNTIDVSNLASETVNEAADETVDNGDADEESEDTGYNYNSGVAGLSAAASNANSLSAAERKAQVEALLKGNKRK